VRATEKRFEPLVLIALAAALFLALGVIQLGIETRSEQMPDWDKNVMKSVRECTDRVGAPFPLTVKEAIRDFSALGSMAILGLISVTLSGYLLLRRDYYSGSIVLLSWLGSWLLMDGLKLLYGRTRPDVVLKLQEVTGYSFPSGHTMVSTVVYLVIAMVLTRQLKERSLRIYVLGLASLITFIVGFSRVYLGVHYPSDVLAGWGFGLIFVIGVWLGTRKKPAAEVRKPV